MPASAASNHPSRPEDLIARLKAANCTQEAKLKALRDLKNQIIGNRTKKMAFLNLGAVPAVVAMLSFSSDAGGQGGGLGNSEFHESVLIQSVAAIGSFACGLDAGVKAVLDEGVFPLLLSLISHSNEKVADAGARSLKMIYQSNLAPKFNFLQEKNMEFLRSLLFSENENIIGLGLSIISHSCKRNVEQQALSEAGVVRRLFGLLGGSLTQRDASLESLVAVIKKNPEIAKAFIAPGNGGDLNAIIELMKDKHPRTRLLACICIVDLRNSLVPYLQESVIKNKLVLVLRDLIDDYQVRDEAPFVLTDLIAEKEDMQKLAFDSNVIEKLCEHLTKDSPSAKCLQGILLALSNLCSKLECCRDRVLNLQVLHFLSEAISHDSAAVRAAFCTLLKNVARSVKNLRAGHFMNENVVAPLVKLLSDSSISVQIAALCAISNIVVDFNAQKTVFIRYGGLKQLVELSQSMESAIRTNALWALKNLAFLGDNSCKEEILLELSTSTLASLINDPEVSVQEQALALTRNLVDGTLNSIEYVFGEDGLLLHAIVKQLQYSSKAEVLIQGMYTMSNIASGNEHHKEAVMSQLFPQTRNDGENILTKHLQSSNSQLRTAAAWTIINLTVPSSQGACDRVSELRIAGIVSQLKTMVNDPCLDAKLRTRTASAQLLIFGDT